MSKVFFSISLVIMAFCAMADTLDAKFEAANALYREKNYDNAITAYQSILDKGYESAAIYFNMGNSYFYQNKIAPAILHYEKAQKLNPNDEDIAFNLKLANLKVVDKVEALPELFITRYWKQIVSFNTSRNWAVWLLAFFWLALLSATLFVLSKNYLVKRLTFLGGLVFFSCALVFTLIAQQQFKTETGRSAAIVFSPSAYVKSAPDETSKDLFILHEGVKVDVTDGVGNWKKIRLKDGKVGWLLAGNLSEI